MLNRKKMIIAFGVIALIIVISLASVLKNETWLSHNRLAIHIVIDNRTNQRIGPFTISDDQESEQLRIDSIEPFSAKDIYFEKPETWGENAISMIDSNGNIYPIVPYFETQQKGRVDIRVECITPNGLSGMKRNLLSDYFSFDWNSWGVTVCE